MSEKERRKRHTPASRSRIARSLHEDATRRIGDDLNIWPQIRARIVEEQEEGARARNSLSARVKQEETFVGRGEGINNGGRERTRHLNLTRMLPSALVTICMVAFVITAYLLPDTRTKPSAPVDACGLMTKAEVESLTGAPMEQFRWEPNMPELVACAYFGKNEMMNVMVADFKSQQEADAYLRSIRPDLLSGIEVQKIVLNTGPVGSNPGRRIDISGDEGYSTSRTPSNNQLSFWDVLVRQHNRYFIITWMTSVERPDPTDLMEGLARQVAARLPSR